MKRRALGFSLLGLSLLAGCGDGAVSLEGSKWCQVGDSRVVTFEGGAITVVNEGSSQSGPYAVEGEIITITDPGGVKNTLRIVDKDTLVPDDMAIPFTLKRCSG